MKSTDAKAREKWVHRGAERPKFATPTKAGQESVWDYPRPPILQPDTRHVQVFANEHLVAESNETYRVLETASPPTFYLPTSDVNLELLKPTTRTTHCEWKGDAREYEVDGIQAAAWSYFDTLPEFDAINGFYSFYPRQVKCVVAGEIVTPQPGGYYGGWVTKEIVGPFKSGDRGTASW